jgi:hypothetical protein
MMRHNQYDKPIGSVQKMLKYLFEVATLVLMLFISHSASAVETVVSSDDNSVLGYLTDKNGKYTGPTVEDNVLAMDTDKNGFADVTEVRAFLALKHGKDYQKAVLDRWEVSALGGGCPVPFAKEFYQ